MLHAKQMKKKYFFYYYFNLIYIHAGLLKVFFLVHICVLHFKKACSENLRRYAQKFKIYKSGRGSAFLSNK